MKILIQILTLACFSIPTAPLTSVALAQNDRLPEAAGFVISDGHERWARGPVARTWITEDRQGVLFQIGDDPCVFQYRYTSMVPGPGGLHASRSIKQADFRKIKKWWMGRPYVTVSSKRLQLLGDKAAWCELGNVPDDVFSDPKWTFAKEFQACKGFVEFSDREDQLERIKDAAEFISRDFCPYEGKPY